MSSSEALVEGSKLLVPAVCEALQHDGTSNTANDTHNSRSCNLAAIIAAKQLKVSYFLWLPQQPQASYEYSSLRSSEQPRVHNFETRSRIANKMSELVRDLPGANPSLPDFVPAFSYMATWALARTQCAYTKLGRSSSVLKRDPRPLLRCRNPFCSLQSFARCYK